MYIGDIFDLSKFPKGKDSIKENSWSDGTNAWTSEHDQWTKENINQDPINALTGVGEAIGYESNKSYAEVGPYKRYTVYVTKKKFNEKFGFVAVAVNPRTNDAKFKAAGPTQQEAVAKLYAEVDKEIDVATKVSGAATIDFNVDFVKDILEMSSNTFYAKIISGPKLVIAGKEMEQYPDIMKQEGFRASSIRTVGDSESATKLPAMPLSASGATTAQLIANGRYVLGAETTDQDGNRIFDLEFDSVVADPRERMRMGAPAITIGTKREQKESSNDPVAIDSTSPVGGHVEEGYQDFNKVEPYAVCLAGRPVKKFDYYEQARRFHDNWKQKLYREGNQAKADKITLNPVIKEGDTDSWYRVTVETPNGKQHKIQVPANSHGMAKKKGLAYCAKNGISGANFVSASRMPTLDEQGVAESKEVDMTGKKCNACKKGTYQETSIHDDMDGVLHCTKCGKQVDRWQAYKEPVKEDWIDDDAAEPLARYFADLYYGDFSATEKVKLTAYIYQSIQDGKLSIDQLKADIDMLEKEKGLNEFAPGGTMKPPAPPTAKKKDPFEDDDRSQLLMSIKNLLDKGAKIDSYLFGARGHITGVANDYFGFYFKKLNKPHSKSSFVRPMDGEDDESYMLKLVKPGYYQLWDKSIADTGEQGVAEGIVDTIRSKNYARLADRSADKRATALDNFDEPEHQKQTNIMKQRKLKSRLLNKKGVAEADETSWTANSAQFRKEEDMSWPVEITLEPNADINQGRGRQVKTMTVTGQSRDAAKKKLVDYFLKNGWTVTGIKFTGDLDEQGVVEGSFAHDQLKGEINDLFKPVVLQIVKWARAEGMTAKDLAGTSSHFFLDALDPDTYDRTQHLPDNYFNKLMDKANAKAVEILKKKGVAEGATVAYVVTYFDTKTGDRGESTVSALTGEDARDKIVQLMHERGYDITVTGVRSAVDRNTPPEPTGVYKKNEFNIGEAGNPAQQAAIAIAMKKAHKKPKANESQNYWRKLQNERSTKLNSLVNELKESISK